MVAKMYKSLLQEDMDNALRLLQAFLSTVPYTDNTDYEGHYQQMMYIIFSLLGMYVDVEVRTPRGRVDRVMRTPTKLYVVELKLDGNAAGALEQINLKTIRALRPLRAARSEGRNQLRPRRANAEGMGD